MAWVLLLNDMRASNIENIQPVCRADSKEALLTYLKTEKVEHYRDGQWGKTYRPGGPLEWFNPPWEFEERSHFQNVGTREDWMNSAARRYDQEIMALPEVS